MGRDGLGSLTVAGVAAEAGVSRQWVYGHFSNLDDLYRSLILDRFAALEASIDAAEKRLTRTELVAFGVSSVPFHTDRGPLPIFDIRPLNNGRPGILTTPALGHALAEALGKREAVLEDTVYRGNGEDDGVRHLTNFFQSVKSRKPVVEDAVFGNHAALACHMANESYFRKGTVTWDGSSGTIRG